MKLEEYQAKKLLEDFQIATPPNGGVISDPEELAAATRKCGPAPWVIKAQVQTGGRGKAGGIQVTRTFVQAKEFTANLIGKKLVTAQTGPEGITVKRVLVEKTVELQRELYLSIAIDRKKAKAVLIASSQGGMDIEETAAQSPSKIETADLSPTAGLETYQARQILFRLGLADSDPKIFNERIQFFKRCVTAFFSLDASLLEINPLALTLENQLVALDAKLIIDDNALFRQAELKNLESSAPASSAELQAKKAQISYVPLKGSIGCLVNGAGLAMATMDILKQYGGEPANFLDVGGGASVEQVTAAFKIILSDKKVKAVLVNIFGGIMKCDLIAEGVLTAVQETKLNVPLVVRLEGNRAEEGQRILAGSNLNIVSVRELAEAAMKAVELAGQTAELV